MSYTDLRDFEPEFTRRFEHMTVEIEKVGGGTLGSVYTGEMWRYRVTNDEKIIARGQDLYIGWAATHRDAAVEVRAFLRGEE